MSLEHDQIVRLLLARRSMVLGYIRSIIRDADLAEDVYQEISLIAIRKRDEIRDESHFGGWIRQAARLEALTTLRRERRGPQIIDDAILDSLDQHWAARDSDQPAPRLAALIVCLEKLTARARKIVDLRYAEGLTGERLAERLACPLNTAYVALTRIHRKLGDCIERELAREDHDV